MKYLGIDYGKHKIGLAISEGLTASPLMILQISGLKDAIAKVLAILKKENIDEVVVGVPESGQSYLLVKKFIKELEKVVVVKRAEETLSSKQALAKMIQLGLPKNKRQQEDSYAAVIILQNYLNQ